MVGVFSDSNQVISAIKEKNVNFNCYSDIGKLMKDFDTYGANNDLFSFLIENNLNRYLFGAFIRLGSLDVNNFYFKEKALDPNFIKLNVKESFIKIFSCDDCNQILFREHVADIKYNEDYEAKCVRCDKPFIFNYNDLEDDMNINRNDLINFLNRLHDINIVNRELTYYCPSCKKKESFNEDINLKCECGKIRELKYYYSFIDDFFDQCLKNRDGRWFEWYVFKISQHIHQYADHNLMISCDDTEEPWDCEIDVASIDNDGNLILFECKDYFREISFKEMENLNKLSSFCENTNFVSSSKKVSNRIKSDVKDYCGDVEINFIEGVKLEESYLSEDIVSDIFLNQGIIKGIRLFQKMNVNKKNNIFRLFISYIINSDAKDPTFLKVMSKMIWVTKDPEIITNNEIEDIKNTIELSVDNIKNGELVADSIEYIRSVFSICKTSIIDVININEIVELGTSFLSPHVLRGYAERKPFYHFFTHLFEEIDVQECDLDEEIMERFLLKMVHMLGIYYADYSRKSTLGVFNTLWEYTTSEIRNNLISKCERILLSSEEHGNSKKIVNSFLADNYVNFNDPEKERVDSLISRI